MFKRRMEIVHNHCNGYRDWLFYENVFPQRESTSIMSLSMPNDSHFRDYLEVYSLSSDQVFL